MKKARSRLNPVVTPVKNLDTQTVKINTVVERKNQVEIKKVLGNRSKHFPTLVIGIFFTFLLIVLVTIFSPDQLKNFVLPNSFLPFFACFLLASFFLLSWLLLDSVIGMWWAIWLTSFVFLRVQQVAIGWPELIFFALGCIIGVLAQMWRRSIHHQN